MPILGAPFSGGAQEGFWGLPFPVPLLGWERGWKWGRFSALQHRKKNSYYSWKAKALLTTQKSRFWLRRDHPGCLSWRDPSPEQLLLLSCPQVLSKHPAEDRARHPPHLPCLKTMVHH